MTDFNGRTILVTGAGGGIGGETVRQLVAAGAHVLASGRSHESVAAIVEETGADALPFDLESEESIRAAIEGVDLYGVVNCGGWGGELFSVWRVTGSPTAPQLERLYDAPRGGTLQHAVVGPDGLAFQLSSTATTSLSVPTDVDYGDEGCGC